jgi:hypothetical protein
MDGVAGEISHPNVSLLYGRVPKVSRGMESKGSDLIVRGVDSLCG